MNPGMGLARIRDLARRLVAPIDPPLMLIAGLLVLPDSPVERLRGRLMRARQRHGLWPNPCGTWPAG